MTNNTTKTQEINSRDYMSMPSGMDFELLFDSLNNNGVSLAISVDDFLEDEDEENVTHNMHDLGVDLEFFAFYLQAKVKGFEALRDNGIATIFADADYSRPLNLTARGKSDISGSWCRKDGVLYIVHDDMIDTHAASVARTKRERNKADKHTAAFWLNQMAERKVEMQRDVA